LFYISLAAHALRQGSQPYALCPGGRPRRRQAHKDGGALSSSIDPTRAAALEEEALASHLRSSGGKKNREKEEGGDGGTEEEAEAPKVHKAREEENAFGSGFRVFRRVQGSDGGGHGPVRERK
jgi:hypothetical protein